MGSLSLRCGVERRSKRGVGAVGIVRKVGSTARAGKRGMGREVGIISWGILR